MKILLAMLLLVPPVAAAPELEVETLSFASQDGLELTADHYRTGEEGAPLIVLFHQAGWSRGEYLEIAPRLCALGYDCLAVDQRSGGAVNDVVNRTHERAQAAHKGTSYVDAEPDLVSALEFARDEPEARRVLAWGSSYSAALVLRVTAEHPGLADACVAFSPGEYFERLGKPADWIERSTAKLAVPTFVTSAGSEKGSWASLYAAIPEGAKRSYLPESAGQHGSRALWKRFDDSPGYWRAVEGFLAEHFPARPEARDAKPTSGPASRPVR